MKAAIAKRLERARKHARKSIRSIQTELHGRTPPVPGSSYPNVHAYFSGKTQPPVEFLSAVADLLGVRKAWLAFNEGEMTPERQAAAGGHEDHSPEEREASRIFLAVMAAIEELGVNSTAEDVLRSYYYHLLDARDDAPTAVDGIMALMRSRFPRTVEWSVRVDGPSGDAILFGEASAAYALDLLSRPWEQQTESSRHPRNLEGSDASEA